MKNSPRKTIYRTWSNMKERCLNPKNDHYHNYGGRGISICDRWLKSFQNFYEDMGPRPEGYSLDRINVNGNYEPFNCRWASKKEQARNLRKSRIFNVNGVTYHVADLQEVHGVDMKTIHQRLLRGMPLEQAVSKEKFYNNKASQAKASKRNAELKALQTHCKRGHPLSGDNLYVVNNRRVCRICKRAHDKYIYYGKVESIEFYLPKT